MAPLFEIRNVSVWYGGLAALTDVSVVAEESSIHGLIGPNGAGKSTLFNVATGLVSPRRGSVLLGGVDVTKANPHRRARLGLARTFQQLELFGVLTVFDNLLVAGETYRRWSHDRTDARDSVREMLERMRLEEVSDSRADHLPMGLARLVEVARALMTRPKVLLLDEPAAGLNESETRRLGDALRAVAAAGVCIVLVEHDMDLVMPVCGRVTVLDQGQVLANGTPDEVRSNELVLQSYLGTPAA